jgi:hypothetical protein
MSILKSIKRKLAIRFQYLIRKRAQKEEAKRIIEKYSLNDKAEQECIINQFKMMQSSKRAFGRKKQKNIKDKISFMIYHKLIKVAD